MKQNTQSGFSLVELLLVVTIIGIIAALGVPSLQKGIRAADNGAAYAQMRVISSVQMSFYSQHGRFARLDELNSLSSGSLGDPSGAGLKKGRFVYEMSPLTPTDAELKETYTVFASGVNGVSDTPYVFKVTQSGEITQQTP
jgi:prepilin-type N-terminal cleavage/methylation domain-containing protein